MESAGEVAAAGACRWDAIVIGAGPAGGVAALALARAGARVLLAERAAWPRAKVCGCCLSLAGATALRGAGVTLPASSEFRAVRVRCGAGSGLVPGAVGVVIERRDLDAAIVRAAVEAGATFVPSCRAHVVSRDRTGVTAALGGDGLRVRARSVVAADGVGGSSLAGLDEFRPRVARGARFGASLLLPEAPAWLQPGVVEMTVGPGGYVGAVRLGDGRANLAAALDPRTARRSGGPARAAGAILRSAGIEPLAAESGRWHGTPTLTRSRPVQSGRVLVVGDAAGYVEPFTGEGMTWAVAGALAAVPHVLDTLAARGAVRETWHAAHRRLLGGRHRACRVTAGLIRLPRLVRGSLAVGVVRRAVVRLLEPRAVPA